MSRRVDDISDESKEAILSAAKNEFEKHGFDKASLRRISKEAGLSFGFFSRLYDKKDLLFEEVVSEVTVPLINYIKEHYESELSCAQTESKAGEDEDFQNIAGIIEFYFQNKQAWNIVLKHTNHLFVRAFIESFIDTSVHHYMKLILVKQKESSAKGSVSLSSVRQYIEMQLHLIIELLVQPLTKEEMLEQSKYTIKMLRGAFFSFIPE